MSKKISFSTTKEIFDAVNEAVKAQKQNGFKMNKSRFISKVLAAHFDMNDFFIQSVNGVDLPEDDEARQRNLDMIDLRFKKFWTLQKIGDKYGISRQRVAQILGNTGRGYASAQKELLVSGKEELTNNQVAKETGLHPRTIQYYRKNKRYKIDGDEKTPVVVGRKAEDWAIQLLKSKGFEVEGMPHRHPYDLEVNGWRVDVKYAGRLSPPPSLVGRIVSQHWTFHVGKTYDDKCDFYFLITEEEDIFIVPAKAIKTGTESIRFCYPSKRPSLGKYQKYLNRYDLLEQKD